MVKTPTGKRHSLGPVTAGMTHTHDNVSTPFEKVHPAMALAARRLDRDVSLEAMAEAAATSRFHLHRVFSAVARETPKQFSLRLRLAQAAARLLAGRESVLRVALDCGFGSHEGFTRAFQRRFGMTPTAYRARGFAAGATDRQAASHREIVEQVGPCVGLYHLNQDRIRGGISMTYTIAKKQRSPEAVLVERRRVGRAEIATTIGEVLSRLFQYAQQEGLALTGKPFTRYLDVGPGLMTMEPGMRVASSDGTPAEPSAADASGELTGVRRDTLPGGSVAYTIHAGPYEDLHEAYAAIEAWMLSEGLTATGAPWESYLTSPVEHPDPRDWKTEVCWPVG